MKQLTVFEMEAISGGYSWDFSSVTSTLTSLASNGVEALASVALGAVVTAVTGIAVGGMLGSSNGGLLGFGLLGNAVGAVVGAIAGAIGGAAGALALGWDGTLGYLKQLLDSVLDGTFTPWPAA